ncbi:hypothetical protein [Candidatus Ponderosibacter sp. Uisw_141_02]|uniref:hypothetical protein n=1 Tax=Candidatus Ponderosibacter sp. Uisw_141_02 TaxID=3231000 RepID=UPI003D50B181
MLTAELNHVTSVEEFYSEIRSQQQAHHGEDYCAMHDAIRHYMKDCESYKEIGTHQGGSAAAVMTGAYKPKYMELIDINQEKYRWKLQSLAEPYCNTHGIELVVTEANSAALSSLSYRRVDMLVIDSLHKRFHMEKELRLHAGYVNKYIVAHDTTIAQDKPLDALFRCLSDFCDRNPRWEIIERGESNVGYTVLKCGV